MIKLLNKGFGNAQIVNAKIVNGLLELTVISDDKKMLEMGPIDHDNSSLIKKFLDFDTQNLKAENHYNQLRIEDFQGKRCFLIEITKPKKTNPFKMVFKIPNCVYFIKSHQKSQIFRVIILPKQKKRTKAPKKIQILPATSCHSKLWACGKKHSVPSII